MSLDKFKEALKAEQLICPTCQKPIKKFDKYVDRMASVWDGAGDSLTETAGSLVTLICGNDSCAWKERTEYWEDFRA